ncbi:MAG: hypothetical protein Tsb009_22360 [Planctomycetaceae bacterium]
MKRLITVCLCGFLAFSISGCGGGDPQVSVVDLNKVLDIFEKVLKEPAPGGGANTAQANSTNNNGKSGDPNKVQPLDSNKENAATTKAFLTKLSAELNKAKLIEDHMGVQLRADGAVEGFIDENKNGRKDGANDKKLFTVEIDYERSRLIATDDTGQGGETYRRDRPYRFRPGGFFMGYMLGSMMGRQNRYYSGARASSRPRFGSMKMSSKNYHSKAVTSARSRAKASGRSYNGRSTKGRGFGGGARSGGSRSFRGGK